MLLKLIILPYFQLFVCTRGDTKLTGTALRWGEGVGKPIVRRRDHYCYASWDSVRSCVAVSISVRPWEFFFLVKHLLAFRRQRDGRLSRATLDSEFLFPVRKIGRGNYCNSKDCLCGSCPYQYQALRVVFTF